MITIEMLRDAIAADEMTWADYREAKKELREILDSWMDDDDEDEGGEDT